MHARVRPRRAAHLAGPRAARAAETRSAGRSGHPGLGCARAAVLTGDVHDVLALVDQGVTVHRLVPAELQTRPPLLGYAVLGQRAAGRALAWRSTLLVAGAENRCRRASRPGWLVFFTPSRSCSITTRITRGANAAVAVGIVRQPARQQRKGPSCSTRSVHGDVARPFGRWRRRSRFCFVLVTGAGRHRCCAAGVAATASGRRPSRPRPRSRTVSAASSTPACGCSEFAGRLRFVAERYADVVVREDGAGSLHVLRELSREESLARFARAGRPGAGDDREATTPERSSPQRKRYTVGGSEALDGSGQHSKRR